MRVTVLSLSIHVTVYGISHNIDTKEFAEHALKDDVIPSPNRAFRLQVLTGSVWEPEIQDNYVPHANGGMYISLFSRGYYWLPRTHRGLTPAPEAS